MRLAAVAAAAALLAACTTAPAIQPGLRLREDTRPQCEGLCEQLGMRLGAIVLIRSSAGCVCEPRPAPPAPGAPPDGAPRAAAAPASAAIAGGALIGIDEDEHRDEEEHQERP